MFAGKTDFTQEIVNIPVVLGDAFNELVEVVYETPYL